MYSEINQKLDIAKEGMNRHDKIVKMLSSLKKELSEMSNKLCDLTNEKELITNCKEDYRMLFEEKKTLLEIKNPMISEKLMELEEKEAECKSECREIDEAIRVGKAVLEVLDKAIHSLDSAKGWGTWDLLGGGFVSDMAKHSHIDDAKNSVEQVQSLLRSFRSELTDINIQDEIHIDISDFSKFADFFFDGLIADWSMQSKIDHSLNSVTSVRNKVQSILAKLNISKRNALLKETDIKSQKEGIILNA